jgi:hypothetical protein
MSVFDDDAFAGAWVGEAFKCKGCLGDESEVKEANKVKAKDVKEAKNDEYVCDDCGQRPE